jgi:amidase
MREARPVILLLALLAVPAVPVTSAPARDQVPFTVVEATIPDMQKALASGRVRSRDLVRQSLLRIATYEDRLNAVITVNPRALEEADARDQERARGRVRGPLHGIPIALKDNILTRDLRTTGGALAFDTFVPPYDATVTTRLREAGAVIVAKTQMTELANWVAGPPTSMPSNYNALTGYGFNPYDLRREPREATADGRPALATGGSSSGTGTAVSFWAANVGTETCEEPRLLALAFAFEQATKRRVPPPAFP